MNEILAKILDFEPLRDEYINFKQSYRISHIWNIYLWLNFVYLW